MQERSRITKDPVYLIAPDKIHVWLKFYETRYEPVEKLYTLTPNNKLSFNQHELNSDTERELYEALNVKDISTVPVNHCAFSYGVALTLTNGQKIVYRYVTYFNFYYQNGHWLEKPYKLYNVEFSSLNLHNF